MQRRRAPRPQIVAIYTRVSTSDQATSGLGLADQLERCRAYVRAQALDADAEVVVFTDAGVSAKNLDRPELARLMRLVEQKSVKAVVVLKTDRIARRTIDLLRLVEMFDRRSVAFASVRERLDTGTPMGRMVLTILGAVAQAEREAISERTKSAIATKLRQGFAHGWTPLGFANVHGRLVPDPDEQETVEMMVALRGLGLSLRAIAEELKAAGRVTKRGGSWGPQNIANVLRRADAGSRGMDTAEAA